MHRDRLALSRLILALQAHPPRRGGEERVVWEKALARAKALREALNLMASRDLKRPAA